MQKIVEPLIKQKDGGFYVTCLNCKKENKYTSSYTARQVLKRKVCKRCYPRSTKTPVRRNEEGKWLSHCPKCGREQAYTRADHARNSERFGWHCQLCMNRNNCKQVGPYVRLYNRYKKSATQRDIPWRINMKQFKRLFTGHCALTGWPIDLAWKNGTASFDRIDSKKEYRIGNVQWVHKIVNMTKNKYPEKEYIEMCKAIAEFTKKKK